MVQNPKVQFQKTGKPLRKKDSRTQPDGESAESGAAGKDWCGLKESSSFKIENTSISPTSTTTLGKTKEL